MRRTCTLARCWIAALALVGVPSFCQAGVPGVSVPSFARDVIPALTKSGCNSGACHGAFSGRGGFRLSLLGFDAVADYESIALDSRGRRVLPASPANSLLLRKATGAMPHGGGVRLTADEPAYKILHDYIAAGLPATPPNEPKIIGLDVTPLDAMLQPNESAKLQVAARWSDGSTRDVTDWALFDARDATATEVTREGQITSLRPGKAAVSVRYLGQVASVAITTPFGPPQPIEFQPVNLY